MSKNTVERPFPTFDDAKIETSERVQKNKSQLININNLLAGYQIVILKIITIIKNQVCFFMTVLMIKASSRLRAESFEL